MSFGLQLLSLRLRVSGLQEGWWGAVVAGLQGASCLLQIGAVGADLVVLVTGLMLQGADRRICGY